MIRISGFIISFLFLFCTPVMPRVSHANSMIDVQADPTNEDNDRRNDTTYFPGLRIGINLVKPVMVLIDPPVFGIEGVLDYNLSPDYFAVAETGFSRRNLEESAFHLKESGVFLRLGVDKNYYKHFNDVVGAGVRLGFSVYDRKAPFISLEQDYWSEYTGNLPSETLYRQWAEVVFTLKTEIFNNIFLGWTLRGKLLLFNQDDRHMNERFIPGFGMAETSSTFGFDFYIFYRIPFRKGNEPQQ